MRIIQSLFLAFTLFLSAHSYAQNIVTLDASSSIFSQTPSAQGTSIHNEFGPRVGSMSNMVAAWKLTKGPLFQVPAGTVFKFIWTDKSSEKGVVVNSSAHVGVEPVPGTQNVPPPTVGGTAGGGGGLGGGGGGIGVIGYTPIYQTTTVCIAGSCWSETTIIGYEPIIGPRDQSRLIPISANTNEPQKCGSFFCR